MTTAPPAAPPDPQPPATEDRPSAVAAASGVRTAAARPFVPDDLDDDDDRTTPPWPGTVRIAGAIVRVPAGPLWPAHESYAAPCWIDAEPADDDGRNLAAPTAAQLVAALAAGAIAPLRDAERTASWLALDDDAVITDAVPLELGPAGLAIARTRRLRRIAALTEGPLPQLAVTRPCVPRHGRGDTWPAVRTRRTDGPIPEPRLLDRGDLVTLIHDDGAWLLIAVGEDDHPIGWVPADALDDGASDDDDDDDFQRAIAADDWIPSAGAAPARGGASAHGSAPNLGVASLASASLGSAALGAASLGSASLGSASLGSASLGSASLGSAAALGTSDWHTSADDRAALGWDGDDIALAPPPWTPDDADDRTDDAPAAAHTPVATEGAVVAAILALAVAATARQAQRDEEEGLVATPAATALATASPPVAAGVDTSPERIADLLEAWAAAGLAADQRLAALSAIDLVALALAAAPALDRATARIYRLLAADEPTLTTGLLIDLAGPTATTRLRLLRRLADDQPLRTGDALRAGDEPILTAATPISVAGWVLAALCGL